MKTSFSFLQFFPLGDTRPQLAVILTMALLGAAACDAQTQEEIEKAMRDTLLSGKLKGALVSRVEKEVWRGKDPSQSITIHKLGGYELQLADLADGTGIVAVLKDNKVVYVTQTIGSMPVLVYEPSLGIDADQDGAPDVMLGGHSGGMHCCYSYQLLNFGSEFRPGALLEGGSSEISLINAAPQAVFRASDGVLEYWHSSFAESIFSEVLISIDRDRVVLAEAWMRRDPPTPEERAQFAADISQAFASKEGWMQDPENGEPPFVPRALIERMVPLIYSGNGDAAIALLRETWKGSAAARDAVALDLFTRLSNSSYWEGLKTFNGWTGDPKSILAAK